ncbi:PUA-like domain-containing protein [Desarmillaria tabescens]|uniref:PUA-like domain-containing protein n=1 Tax=Armillaria tabescens TaxID=1929756 RepID=A0AA39NR29_ARMTA|nr:PUA-like domain-containing protein [Desarmillaria tabescens]KAK0470059.1 PUA-like domain-containing protein [Desarmillaria tabescens]
MYTDESFRIKTKRKYGKEERKIVKDRRKLDVKDLEGTLGEIDGQSVGTRYVNGSLLLEAGMHGGIRRGIYSFKGSAVCCAVGWSRLIFSLQPGVWRRRSQDGKMQVKDQAYTHGNRALQNTMQTGQPIRVIRGYKLYSKHAPRNGFRYDGWYRVTGCYERRDENGYRTILFKLERHPGQLPIGTQDKFRVYPDSNAPAKTPEPSEPKKTSSTLFPPRPKLPSFNKSSASSHTLPSDWHGAPMLPVPSVKVEHQKENYCNDIPQCPVKSKNPSSVPLLQYPECDVKVIRPSGPQDSTAELTSPISTSMPHSSAKHLSPPPHQNRVPTSCLGVQEIRERPRQSSSPQVPKLSNTPPVKAESRPPFCERLVGSLSESSPRKRKYSNMEDCG